MPTKTIQYYNQNAKAFTESTLSVDFQAIQSAFTAKLPKGAFILDFGCGSGRDAKYFLEKGFQVEAIDGSEELCRLAGAYAGISVRHQRFQDLDEHEKYDGIWACASILHLPAAELAPVLGKMAEALKRGGIIYTSFKYGSFEGERNGRYFTDMTEERFAEFIQGMEGSIQIEEQWITADVRPERGEEKWLNLILQKK